MGRALTIGDGIADLILREDGQEEWHAGGAALNLAVGLSKLGHASVLAGRIGADQNGFRLIRHLRDEQVSLINFPTVDATGVAISWRENGEPRYNFNSAMYRRRVVFSGDLLNAMATADVVAVNTFPFQVLEQARELVAVLPHVTGLFVVDPNPRPNLVRDLNAFRDGFELVVPSCFLVKLSVEDVVLLYAGDEAALVARFLSLGVERILLTRGSQGATFYLGGQPIARVPSTVTPTEVVDTMGAGDATLAAIIDWVLRFGVPQGAETWRASIHRAMDIAGATCQKRGGTLVVPEEQLSIGLVPGATH